MILLNLMSYYLFIHLKINCIPSLTFINLGSYYSLKAFLMNSFSATTSLGKRISNSPILFHMKTVS